MNKVNQKTAVLSTLLSVLNERGVEYALNSETPIKEVLTDADRAKAREILFAAFRSGGVEYKESFTDKVNDDKELKSYVSGLVNNWVRKAKELNNGQAYKAKNPGSRAGNSDPEIKNMKLLLSVTADEDAKAEIQTAIDVKLAEIKAAKQDIKVDMSQIPADLLEKLGLGTKEEE